MEIRNPPKKVTTALQGNAEPQWKERDDKVNKLENTLALSHYRIGQERTLVRDWVDERSRRVETDDGVTVEL